MQRRRGTSTGGRKWEAEKKKTENHRKGKWRTLEDCTVCTSLLPSFNFWPLLYHLLYTSGFPCSPPLWFPLSTLSAGFWPQFKACRRQQEVLSWREEVVARKHPLSLLLESQSQLLISVIMPLLFPPLFWQVSGMQNVSGEKSGSPPSCGPLPDEASPAIQVTELTHCHEAVGVFYDSSRSRRHSSSSSRAPLVDVSAAAFGNST